MNEPGTHFEDRINELTSRGDSASVVDEANTTRSQANFREKHPNLARVFVIGTIAVGSVLSGMLGATGYNQFTKNRDPQPTADHIENIPARVPMDEHGNLITVPLRKRR